MLVERGRLLLDRYVEDWLAQVERVDGITLVSIDREIAVKAVRLPGSFHKDTADRIIVATARKFASPIVTSDEEIISCMHVKTIW